MIDMTAVLAAYLAADPAVAAVATTYADELPETPQYPLALVRTIEVSEAAPPSPTPELHEMQIDLVGNVRDFGPLVEAVTAVRDSLALFAGVHGAVAVVAVHSPSLTRTTDTSVSPARPRWVLAVDVTARDI